MAQDQIWNPVDEVRQNYPALKDWSDDRILENLSDPKKFRSAFPQYKAVTDDQIRTNIGKLRQAAFVAPEDNKEGLYEMNGPAGKISVPYSKVEGAFGAGLRFNDANTFRRFQKDKAAEGPSALQRFSESEFGAIGNAVKGVGQFLDPRATEEEKQRGLDTPLDRILRYPERIVAPHAEEATKAEEAARTGRYSEAVGHGLAAITPMVGPWAAQVGEQVGQQVGSGNVAGALGTLAGNAMVAEAPKIAGKGAGALAETVKKATPVRSAVEAITRTGPRQLRQLAEDTAKENAEAAKAADIKNAEAAETHLGDTLDALQKTREAEDIYSSKEKARREELDRKNEIERKKFNDAELERINKENEERLETLRKNKEKITNYKAELEKTKLENARNYRREVQRQNMEAKLDKASNDLDSKYKAAFNKARGEYNQTWNSWRDMVKGSKADLNPVVDTISSLESSMNPQQVSVFNDILRETGPTESDLSNAGKGTLDRVVSANLYDTIAKKLLKGAYKQALEGEIPPNLAQPVIGGFHEIAARTAGERVAAANAVKESLPLTEVPAERLHAWKSQLERAVRTTQDGTVRYAIGKVLDQLRTAEETVSKSVGPKAVSQLTKARSITGPYFDAFFKSPEEVPKVAGQSLREQTPEYIKERNQQDRLDRIAAYDPSIKTTANLVANLKEGLTNLKKEGGKSIGEYKDLPKPPEVTPLGTKSVARTFTPEEFVPKEEPTRVAPPNRPPEVAAEKKVYSPEDLRNLRELNVKRSANSLREHGIRRSMNALFYTVPSAVFSVLLGHPGYAIAELLSTPAILAGSHALADLLEKKSVVDWVGKVTDKDTAVWNQLPPDQKAVFTKDMKTIADAAEKENIKVSPSLKKFVKAGAKASYKTGAGQGQKNNPKNLLQQAKDLQDQFQQQGLSR